MLGSEYNWLVELTATLDGSPKIRLARSGMFTLVIAVFFLLCVALQATPTEVDSLRSPPSATAPALLP